MASSSKQILQNKEEKKKVKIRKRYLFAGEYITYVPSGVFIGPSRLICAREVVEVSEDSTDAKKWPLYQDGQPVNEGTQPQASESSSIPLTTTANASSSMPQNPSPKKPGPRKPKRVLGAFPSSSTQKPKQLTTLDKSLMDWKTHTGDASLQDELETNRKGGGYLERVEFLKRVDERKEENLESLKSRKRRKL